MFVAEAELVEGVDPPSAAKAGHDALARIIAKARRDRNAASGRIELSSYQMKRCGWRMPLNLMRLTAPFAISAMSQKP
jgi:hypothetical protein